MRSGGPGSPARRARRETRAAGMRPSSDRPRPSLDLLLAEQRPHLVDVGRGERAPGGPPVAGRGRVFRAGRLVRRAHLALARLAVGGRENERANPRLERARIAADALEVGVDDAPTVRRAPVVVPPGVHGTLAGRQRRRRRDVSTPPISGVICRSTAKANARRANSASSTAGYGVYRVTTATRAASAPAARRRGSGSSSSRPSAATPGERASTAASSSSAESGISSVSRERRGLTSSG